MKITWELIIAMRNLNHKVKHKNKSFFIFFYILFKKI